MYIVGKQQYFIGTVLDILRKNLRAGSCWCERLLLAKIVKKKKKKSSKEQAEVPSIISGIVFNNC